LLNSINKQSNELGMSTINQVESKISPSSALCIWHGLVGPAQDTTEFEAGTTKADFVDVRQSHRMIEKFEKK
jgi:hypothetical protein